MLHVGCQYYETVVNGVMLWIWTHLCWKCLAIGFQCDDTWGGLVVAQWPTCTLAARAARGAPLSVRALSQRTTFAVHCAAEGIKFCETHIVCALFAIANRRLAAFL